MTILASIPTILPGKSAIRAMCGSCRRQGIFIEWRTVTVFLRIRLVLRMIIGQGRSVMQVQQPIIFEGIGVET